MRPTGFNNNQSNVRTISYPFSLTRQSQFLLPKPNIMSNYQGPISNADTPSRPPLVRASLDSRGTHCFTLSSTKHKDDIDGTTNGPSISRNIIDIRESKEMGSLKNEIFNMFVDVKPSQEGEGRALPTLLLYDAQGLKLFERITYLDEYYLTKSEIAILTRWAKDIAERIPDECVIIELGSGYLSHSFQFPCLWDMCSLLQPEIFGKYPFF